MDGHVMDCNVGIMNDAMAMLHDLRASVCRSAGRPLDSEVTKAIDEAWAEIKAVYLDAVEYGP